MHVYAQVHASIIIYKERAKRRRTAQGAQQTTAEADLTARMAEGAEQTTAEAGLTAPAGTSGLGVSLATSADEVADMATGAERPSTPERPAAGSKAFELERMVLAGQEEAPAANPGVPGAAETEGSTAVGVGAAPRVAAAQESAEPPVAGLTAPPPDPFEAPRYARRLSADGRRGKT